jgi:hypothetical protein
MYPDTLLGQQLNLIYTNLYLILCGLAYNSIIQELSSVKMSFCILITRYLIQPEELLSSEF